MSLATPRKGYKSVPWLFGKEIEIPEEWEMKRIQMKLEKIVGEVTYGIVQPGKFTHNKVLLGIRGQDYITGQFQQTLQNYFRVNQIEITLRG